MRDELYKKILMILAAEGFDTEQVKSKVIIALNEYDIANRSTEIILADEDTTDKYIKAFIVNKRVAGRSDRTLKYYKMELGRFFNEVQKSPIDISSDDIKLYLAVKEVRDGVSKVYMKNILRVISSFYTWMLREEYIVKNPMNKVDDIKTPKVKKKAFTEIEVEKMRSVLTELRQQLIYEMLLCTWCRVSELSTVMISDISENKESVVVHGKGNKERICYLNARTKLLLEKYLAQRQDNNPYLFTNCNVSVDKGQVFPKKCSEYNVKMNQWWRVKELVGDGNYDKCSIETMIRKVGKKAGVEKAHPHRFRRTGATWALRKGMPIEQVSKLLGHESLETTQIYLDISELEIARAHQKYV